MSFVVVANYVSNPGSEDDLKVHLEAMITPTNAEEGCEVYRVINSNDDPKIFLLFEVYVDKSAFEAHAASGHFERHIRSGAWNLLESRSVILGTELKG